MPARHAPPITFERNGTTYMQPGPNGQTLDKEGRLVFCAMGSGEIRRREANGSITTLVSAYNGRHLNAPNDVVYKSDGALYFTDIRANGRTCRVRQTRSSTGSTRFPSTRR